MKRHFQLTLTLSRDDLTILGSYLEHVHGRVVADQTAIPGLLAGRLREIDLADPTDSAFQYLLKVASPRLTIDEVSGRTVVIGTSAGGTSLSTTIELLGRLVPSCLEGAIYYQPGDTPQRSGRVALH
jgi:hypothetical protein